MMTIKIEDTTIETILQSIREVLEAQKQEPVTHYPDGLMGGWFAGVLGDAQNIKGSGFGLLEATCLFDQGNCRATKALAEKEVAKRAVIQKMKRYAFEPDWSDHDEHKHYLCYNHAKYILRAYTTCFYQGEALFEVYFKTSKNAQACIDELGGKIKEVL